MRVGWGGGGGGVGGVGGGDGGVEVGYHSFSLL